MLGHKIYIAGPMTGRPGRNIAAFARAAKALRDGGWVVFDPAEMPSVTPRLRYIVRDLAAICDADAIYLLSGWSLADGAVAEAALAVWMGLQVICEDPGESAALLRIGGARHEKPPRVRD